MAPGSCEAAENALAGVATAAAAVAAAAGGGWRAPPHVATRIVINDPQLYSWSVFCKSDCHRRCRGQIKDATIPLLIFPLPNSQALSSYYGWLACTTSIYHDFR